MTALSLGMIVAALLAVAVLRCIVRLTFGVIGAALTLAAIVLIIALARA